MSKRTIWLNALALAALILAACAPAAVAPTQAPATQAPATLAPATQAPATQPPTKKYTIGAILFGQDSFFQNIQKGMQDAADAAGVTLLVSIHNHEIAKESGFIDDYISRGVDAIVITPESVDASVASIKKAHDAGIKIVCFNTCINDTDAKKYVSAFYETDQASLGKQTGDYLAKWLAKNMAGKPVIVGIAQCDKFEACKRRGDGFRGALKDAGVTWSEVANQEGFMPDTGQKAAENMITANPTINILWSENEGGTVGEVLAVHSSNLVGKVFVFGTDISTQLAGMLQADDNVLQAVTGQSPRAMGGDSVNAAIAVLKGTPPDYYHVVANAFFSRDDKAAIQKYLDENK